MRRRNNSSRAYYLFSHLWLNLNMSAKTVLSKRLNSYWKLELMNVVLVPAMMIFIAVTGGHKIGLGAYLSMVPMCGLLCLGGIYWRVKYQALEVGRSAIWKAMPLINFAKIPLLLLSLAAIIYAFVLWIYPNLKTSNGSRWIVTASAIMAWLEYINYYHRQLQHFDHWADFKKLLMGKGFRRAQMARDLESWKAKQK